MNTKKLMMCGLIALLSSMSLTGCLMIVDENPSEPEPWRPKETPKKAELKGVYISGHLGNYWDCPEQGYQGEQKAQPEPAERPAGDQEFGACAPSEDGAFDGCGPLNCEAAQVTLELSNIGQLAAQGTKISEILVLDDQDVVRASLPIHDTMLLPNNERYDGALDVGATIKVRVDFAGPVNMNEILGYGPESRWGEQKAKLRIKIKASNANEISIDTKLVSSMPGVAT